MHDSDATPPIQQPDQPSTPAPRPQQNAAPLRPHPVLPGYFGDEPERRELVKQLFDDSARHYEWIIGFMSFWTGSWYRKQALTRAGLKPGMRVLDVACGSGVVTRIATRMTGDSGAVIGLDPSAGMMAVASRGAGAGFVQARAEELPFADASFDILTMGYALRHVDDLATTFREYRRVLKPGGRVLLLEQTPPKNRLAYLLLRFHMRDVVPLVTLLTTWDRRAAQLMRYYWDTVDQCVPPEVILQALQDVDFDDVQRHLELGTFSEYTATRPI